MKQNKDCRGQSWKPWDSIGKGLQIREIILVEFEQP